MAEETGDSSVSSPEFTSYGIADGVERIKRANGPATGVFAWHAALPHDDGGASFTNLYPTSTQSMQII